MVLALGGIAFAGGMGAFLDFGGHFGWNLAGVRSTLMAMAPSTGLAEAHSSS